MVTIKLVWKRQSMPYRLFQEYELSNSPGYRLKNGSSGLIFTFHYITKQIVPLDAKKPARVNSGVGHRKG